MKKNASKYIFALLSVITLASCSPSTTNPDTSGTDSSSTGDTGKTNADFLKANTTYVDKDGETQNLIRNTLYTNAGNPHLDSLSEQHVLVVPFGFKGKDSQYNQTDETIQRIKTTFFGTREELDKVEAWESLSTYFNTSSYGKATFTGEVANSWCLYEGKESEITSGVVAAEYASKWYKEEYAKENHGSLGSDAKPISYFDNNNDGYIDLLWVVYSHPTTDVNDTWWAYVTYTSNKAGTHNSPNVKTLGWASIDWMSGAYDSHTYIHETGHTYGLDDYYDYTSSWSPMGSVDMMDHNLGDHSAYSKFTLGWLNPWVVDDDATITLRSTTLTGDCFVIAPSDYNYTAFDEYMMVEFITPEGLNKQDYINGYGSTSGFTTPGIRVTHVDARVYNSTVKHDSYLSSNPEEGTDLRINNTKGGRLSISTDGDIWPSAQGSTDGNYMANITLIESSFDKTNNPLTTYGYNASDKSLFVKNQSLRFTSNSSWVKTFMPSGTNLWNKAKTITGWTGTGKQKAQTFEVDETMTIDYNLKVLSIQKVDGEWQAKVQVTKH